MSIIVPETELLLHFDGANNSTTLTDSSPVPKNVTAVGNLKLSTAQSKFGGSSIFLGDKASLVSVSSAGFASLFGAMTVEAWIYRTAVNTYETIVSKYKGYSGFTFYLASSKLVCAVGVGNAYVYATSNNTVPMNTWVHVAMVKFADTISLFIDGVLDVSAQLVTGYSDALQESLFIGRDTALNNSTRDFVGYIDEVRISRVARYTQSFAVPTSQFDSGNMVSIGAIQIETKTQYTGYGIGVVGNSAVDTSNAKPISALVNDVLPYGFPDSEKNKLYDKVARSTDATPEPFFDKIGYGTVVGTIKEKSIPSNIPRKCLVYLYRHPENTLIDSVWSDDAGNYEFRGINPAYNYMVLATDPQGMYRAVVADNLTPDPIPQPAY